MTRMTIDSESSFTTRIKHHSLKMKIEVFLLLGRVEVQPLFLHTKGKKHMDLFFPRVDMKPLELESNQSKRSLRAFVFFTFYVCVSMM